MSGAAAGATAGRAGSAIGPTAVVGVGNMGLAMALRLRDAGWPVHVHDVLASRMALAAVAGAQVADSPAAAAAGCARLIVAVVDAAQTEAVLFGAAGAAAALPAGAAVWLCPTIGPADVEGLAARLAAAGLACLDAPMSGGPARARDGTMSLMVAGDAAVIAHERPVLRQLAARLFEISSRPGDGARTKLVNNLLAAVNLAAAAEALALAERVGLDPATTLAVIGASSGQSWIAADRGPRALAGDFAPRAHTRLLAKDSALAVDMAAAAGLAPALGRLAADRFVAALEAGFGDDDDARLFSLARQALPGSATPPVDPGPPTRPDDPNRAADGAAARSAP